MLLNATKALILGLLQKILPVLGRINYKGMHVNNWCGVHMCWERTSILARFLVWHWVGEQGRDHISRDINFSKLHFLYNIGWRNGGREHVWEENINFSKVPTSVPHWVGEQGRACVRRKHRFWQGSSTTPELEKCVHLFNTHTQVSLFKSCWD